MRMIFVLAIAAALLAGCGGNDEEVAAKKQELQKLENDLKALNAEMAEKRVGWQETLNKVIPLRGSMLRAKNTDREAEAKAAFEAAQEAAKEATDAQEKLRLQIQALHDRVTALQEQIRRLSR